MDDRVPVVGSGSLQPGSRDSGFSYTTFGRVEAMPRRMSSTVDVCSFKSSTRHTPALERTRINIVVVSEWTVAAVAAVAAGCPADGQRRLCLGRNRKEQSRGASFLVFKRFDKNFSENQSSDTPKSDPHTDKQNVEQAEIRLSVCYRMFGYQNPKTAEK